MMNIILKLLWYICVCVLCVYSAAHILSHSPAKLPFNDIIIIYLINTHYMYYCHSYNSSNNFQTTNRTHTLHSSPKYNT